MGIGKNKATPETIYPAELSQWISLIFLFDMHNINRINDNSILVTDLLQIKYFIDNFVKRQQSVIKILHVIIFIFCMINVQTLNRIDLVRFHHMTSFTCN